MGIEPTHAAWEAAVLPLNYTRNRTACSTRLVFSPSPSLALWAFTTRNGPLDRFVTRGEPIERHPQNQNLALFWLIFIPQQNSLGQHLRGGLKAMLDFARIKSTTAGLNATWLRRLPS
jgi:hypothetical protein